MKSFLGNFNRHLAIFYGHTGADVSSSVTRLGYFRKVLVILKLLKYLMTLGLFEKICFGHFLGNLKKKMGYVLFRHLVTLDSLATLTPSKRVGRDYF